MMSLLRNELEKIIYQRRFLVVLGVYAVLAAMIALLTRGDVASFRDTAASASSEWVMGGYAQFLIPFLVALMVGDIVAGEISTGTIKLLLVRPVRRGKIWVSKFLAAFLAGAATVLYLELCMYVALGLTLGFGSWSAAPSAGLKTTYATAWALTWRAFALEMLALAAFVSLFLLVSSVVSSGGGATGICTGLVVLGVIIINSGSHAVWIGLSPFPHFGIAGHLTSTFPLPRCSLRQSVVVLCGWTALFNGLGLWSFIRRDIVT